MKLTTMTYEVDGRIARITLDRPARGNGITLSMPRELASCVEAADLDPRVHVIALAGNGKGFCGGYDLVASAERGYNAELTGEDDGDRGSGSPTDPAVIAANHDPGQVWDPAIDYQMMRRNVRGFMSLLRADKPVVCKVHGFCVAGGTDMALCSDLLIVADDAKIGYPPARVWGVPTTALWAHRIGAQRANRLLLTGDCVTGRVAAEWGLACESWPADALDERAEALVSRVAAMPLNQLIFHKLLVRESLASVIGASQTLGTLLDGIARHTPEGHAFAARAMAEGFKRAVHERDSPFDDDGGAGVR